MKLTKEEVIALGVAIDAFEWHATMYGDSENRHAALEAIEKARSAWDKLAKEWADNEIKSLTNPASQN